MNGRRAREEEPNGLVLLWDDVLDESDHILHLFGEDFCIQNVKVGKLFLDSILLAEHSLVVIAVLQPVVKILYCVFNHELL